MKTYHQQQQRTSRILESSPHPNKRYPVQLMRIIQMKKGEEIPQLAEQVDDPQKDLVIQDLTSRIEAAHNVENNDFVQNQQSYMNYLHQNLHLPIEKIMSFHKSAGYEFEFASFKIIGQPKDKNKEYMPSHQCLASSEVLNPFFFNLPFVLETDSNNSIELVSPPFIFLRSYLPERVLSKTFNKYIQKLNEINDQLAGKEATLPAFLSNSFSDNDFGNNWKLKQNFPNIRIISNQKHTYGTYGQANVSMTTEEITKVLTSQKPDEILSRQHPKDPQSILITFEGIQQILEIDRFPEFKDALLLYSRLITNLLGIPSILFRQITTQRSTPNYATDIKEILGVWIKAYPHEIILDYIEKQQIKQRFLVYTMSKQQEVYTYIQQKTDQIVTDWQSQRPDLNLLSTKPQQPEHTDPSAPAVTSGMETNKTDEEGDFLKQSKDMIHFEFQNFMEHLKNNTKPTVPPETNFINEKFGSGFGVRKGTFLTPIETRAGEKLYITELRNQYSLEAYERLYPRTTSIEISDFDSDESSD